MYISMYFWEINYQIEMPKKMKIQNIKLKSIKRKNAKKRKYKKNFQKNVQNGLPKCISQKNAH